MRTGVLVALLGGLLVSGCGQLEAMRLGSAGRGVPIVAVLEEDQPPNALQLGRVSAVTCFNRLWDKRPG